ncbi:MAG TPA: hypothetical protein VES19_12750 [Candidatus Limnocylindrales bacterium]|nr:hypothetical protein [Candidatus Limnocylindrales bacterium]
MHPRHRLVLVPAALVALVLVLVACGDTGAPVVSFDPTGACTADGQQPGAYPELEALLPTEFEGAGPTNVDSGRTCTPDALGSLADAGITELRFAGATWETGGAAGWTLAAFTAEGLTPAVMRDFYEVGARTARRAEKVAVSDSTVASLPAKRLDVLMSDGTGQTVVAWQPANDGPVWVLLAADVGDTKVASLLEAFGSR